MGDEDLKIGDDPELKSFANRLIGLHHDYTELAKSFLRLKAENKSLKRKYDEISANIDKNKACEVCEKLQKRLEHQRIKYKAKCDLLIQMLDERQTLGSDENSKDAPSSSVQIKQECVPIDPSVIVISGDSPPRTDEDIFCTPPKKKRPSDESIMTSPILKPAKPNKAFWSKPSSTTIAKSPGKENQDKRPITTPEKHSKEPKTPKLKVIRTPGKLKAVPDKSPHCKATKQSRLAFAKPKMSLDVTRTNSFNGGMRSSPATDKRTKPKSTKIPLDEKVANIQEDVNIIQESPMTVRTSPKRANSGKASKSRSVKKIIKDDDTTFFETECTEIVENPVIKPSTSYEMVPVEVVYREDAVRKKSEKKNLQGWSCEDCKKFYNVAFSGNEKVLKEKINECSKHRGKFNPARPNTPPGFWDLDMFPSQDTETLNRQNNQT